MKLRPFDKSDWDCFAGVEGDHPMIGELGDSYLVVVDADGIEVYEGDMERAWYIPINNPLVAWYVARTFEETGMQDRLTELGAVEIDY